MSNEKHGPNAGKDAGQISVRRPQIFTGPAHQTVDEATVSYLREAAKRIRDQRYWGSGVTALVSDLLDDVATAVEATAERNPYLPEKPADGKHDFGEHNSYRCLLCGVYNRPDSPPFHEPCQGEYRESGKMRAWARDRWQADRAATVIAPELGNP